MASDVEEAFEMKCTSEMKHEDLRRKDWDEKIMSGTECGKVRKNQSIPESRNESNHVQIAAYYRKVDECDGVNDEKMMMSLGVNEAYDRTFLEWK